MRGLKYDLDEKTTLTAASLAPRAEGYAASARVFDSPDQADVRGQGQLPARSRRERDTQANRRVAPGCVRDRHDLNRLAPGSAVKLIYDEKVSRDGSYTLAGDVQAAQIRFGSRTLTAISFSDEHGRPHLYDEKGHALGPQSLSSAQFPVHLLGLHLPSLASDLARVSASCRR